MAIRFNENGVRPMGRGAAGVKGISLREGDYVVEMDVLPASGEPVPEPLAEGEEPEIIESEPESDDAEIVASDERGQVLTITEKGFGKRTPVSAYRLQSRGGIGVTNIKTTEKNGKVAGISYVFEDDQVLLITEQGMIIRTNVADIRSIGRSTQGVRIINIDENDLVVAAVKLVDKDDGEDEVDGAEVEAPESDSDTPDDDTIH
jgi:DNA gyrase subunit A